MKAKNCGIFLRTILIISIVIFFSFFNSATSFRLAESQPLTTVCSECDNPLVEFGTCKITGDLPDFEAWGWNVSDLKKTGGELETVTDILHRGLGVYIWFKKANPCADFYYIIDNGLETSRTGSEGEAKYRIDSYVEVEKCTEGEKTLVWDETSRRTELNPPRPKPGGGFDRYDIEELSLELKLVPTIAKVHITHQLKCLKNGRIYDEDYNIYDWIDQPPGTDTMGEQPVEILHDYGFPDDGDNMVVDGEIHTGAEGWYLTGFSTPTLAAAPMEFEKGEIGETIRRMETPSSCQISVDTNERIDPKSKQNVFKLNVTNIKNKFDEVMPDNVLIGLKLREGKITSGEVMDGWYVFNTTGGKITDEVLFLPAQCAITDTDILEVCLICQFHDGDPYAGSMQFTKEVINPLCHDAILTITASEEITKDLDKAPGEKGDDRYIKNHYSSTIDGKITLTLKKHSEQNMAMYGFKWVNYMSTSMSIDKFTAGWDEHQIESRSGEFAYETVHNNRGEMTNYKWGMPEMPSMVTLVYDTKTNKVKSIMFRANYSIAYTMDITEKWETVEDNPKGEGTRTRGDEKNKTKNERFTFGPVEERVPGTGIEKWIYPDLQVSSGDGRSRFGGRGSVEKEFDCDTIKYEKCHESKTFEWNLTVNTK